MALLVGKLTAQLDLEDDQFRSALDKAKLKLAAFPQRRTVELRLDETAFSAAARRAEILLTRAARPRTARITVAASGSGAEAAIGRIARTRTARIRTEADMTGAASLAGLSGARSAQIRAEADTASAESALSLAAQNRTSVITAIARTVLAESAIATVARARQASITVDVDSTAAESVLAHLARARSATITANSDTAAAEAALTDVARDRRATVTVDTDTTSTTGLAGLATNRRASILAEADTAAAESVLAHAARTRVATIRAEADTDYAEAALAAVARDRRAQITADAEVAASEAALAHLARDRTATIHTNVTGGGPNLPNLPGLGGGGGAGGGASLGSPFVTAAAAATKASAAFWAAQAAAAAALPIITQFGAALGGTMVAGAGAGIAALAAYGVATATLKVGLTGIKEAAAAALDPEKSKEFWAAMEKLSPAARQSMLAVRGLGQAWEQAGVKAAVQEKLFAHLGPQIGGLSKHIGAVKASMLSAAGGFSAGAGAALQFVNSAQGTRIVSTILAQSGVAAGNLGRAFGAMIPGVLALGSASTSAFSQMSAGLERNAQYMSRWLTAAEKSGYLDHVFADAREAASSLGSVLMSLGGIVRGVFAAANDGSTSLSGIADGLDRINQSVNYGDGGVALREYFDNGRESAAFLGSVIRGVTSGLGALFESAAPGFRELRGAIESIAPEAEGRFSAIGELIGAFASGLSSLVPAAAAFGEAFTSGLSIAAGLVQAITVPLSALAGIVEDNEGAVTALAMAYIGLRVIPGLIGQMRTGFAAQAAATATASTSTVQHATALQTLGGAAQRAHAALTLLGMRATTVANANGILINSMGRIVLTSNQGSIALGRFGSAIARLGTYVPVVQRMQAAFIQTALAASVMARTAGVAAAALTGLKAGGLGVAGLFGGPLGLALTAAAIGGGILASKSADASAAMDRQREAAQALKLAQVELAEALMASGGEVDSNVITKQADEFGKFREELKATSELAPTAGDQIRRAFASMGGVEMGTRADDLNEMAGNAREAGKALDGLGMTSEKLRASVYGSQQDYDSLRARLVAMGAGGQAAAQELDGLRAKALAAADVARRSDPAYRSVAAAFRVMGDEASSASDKAKALQDALDALSGGVRSKAEAQKRLNDEMRRVGDEIQRGWDATDGYGKTLRNVDGTISTTTANGSRLHDMFGRLTDELIKTATTTGKVGPAFANIDAQIAELAPKIGVTTAELRKMLETTFGLDKGRIELFVGLSGKDEATTALASLKMRVDAFPDKKTFEIEMPKNEATIHAIEETGAKVERLPNGMIKVTVDDQTKPKLNGIVASMTDLQKNPAIAKIGADGAAFHLENGKVRTELESLSKTHANTKIGAAIDQFLAGKNVVASDLAFINSVIAKPEIKADFQKFLNDMLLARAAVNAVPAGKAVNVDAPGGKAVYDLLKAVGVEARIAENKDVHVAAPLAQSVIDKLKELGIVVEQLPDGTINVKQVGAEAAETEIKRAAEDRNATITVHTVYTGGASIGTGRGPNGESMPGVVPGLADGAVRQRAAGALDTAQIANGSGSGRYANTPLGPVQWAEGETDWEAFIPGARSKRPRALSILAETARRFGLDLIPAGVASALAQVRAMADGGVLTAGALKSFARGIDGAPYVWGGWGNGWKTDCSGGQSSLMERATGRSTVAGAKHRAGTASFDAYTRDHGLKPGLPPAGTAAYSVGWNPEHTSGTIHDPSGGDVNVEMGGANGGGKYGSSVGSKDISGSHAWMPLQGDPGKDGDIGTSGGTSADVGGTSGYGTDGGKGSSQNVWVMNWPSKIADPAVKNAVASAVLTKYAHGGVEDHRAQIAPAGAMRLWAEPETGGEAYIPLAPDKRPRSLAIWRETGRRLGVGQFALGGFGGHQTPEMIAAVQPTEHAPGYYAEQAYRLGVAGWGAASMVASAFSGGKFSGFSTGANSIPQIDERLKELAEKIEKGEKVSVGIYVGPGGRIVVDDQDELLRRQKAAAEDALNRRGSSV